MKRIATYTLLFGLTLGITMDSAHAFGPAIIIRGQYCAALKAALDNAEKNVRQCISNCRKTLENANPPFSQEQINASCGISIPGIPYQAGSQCRAAEQAHLDALLAHAQCNPPARQNPLLPKSGAASANEFSDTNLIDELR